MLVVAETTSLGVLLASWLRDSGYTVDLVATYPAGKIRLDQHPRVLVTQLELGAYNGLQLALHARAGRVPSIVVGPSDPVLQREAEQLGITYVRRDQLSGEYLADIVLSQAHQRDDDPVAEGILLFDRPRYPRAGRPRRALVH